jgi:hypothetical protein
VACVGETQGYWKCTFAAPQEKTVAASAALCIIPPASSYVIVTTHDTCKQQQQHHLLVKQKSLRPILHMRRSLSFSPNSSLSHRCWTGTRNGTKHPPVIMAVLWVGYSKPSKCPVFLYATLVPPNIWRSQITVQKTSGSFVKPCRGFHK